MQMTAPRCIDTKTIIVNLLKEDEREYLSVERLHRLLAFIYRELRAKCRLEEYLISFDINFDAIERTVLYNRNIFGLDIEGENIYLKEPEAIDRLASRYQVDETIREIIGDFVRKVA